jgi:hypothetical protein
MLLKFSRKNVIESSNSSSDSDDNKYDTLKLLENKKDLVKLSAMIKVKRTIKHFEGNEIDSVNRDLL